MNWVLVYVGPIAGRETTDDSTVSRRSILRTTGIALATGVAATTPTIAASTDQRNVSGPQSEENESDSGEITTQWGVGTRVKDRLDSGTNVYTGVYEYDNGIGKTNGNEHGEILTSAIYSPYFNMDMIEVEWFGSALTGWVIKGNVTPENCLTC